MRHKKKKQAKPIVCVNCKRAYEGRLSCPECGTCPVIKGKMVPTLEAYLQELDAKEIPEGPDNKTFYRELLGYAAAKNFKPGWAWFKYQERFKMQPGNMWRKAMPLEPSLDTKSWVRSRMIAWAESSRNLKREYSGFGGLHPFFIVFKFIHASQKKSSL